jgi:hypothetical protein
MGHSERLPRDEKADGAFDVAFRWRWTGAAESKDVRDSTWISPPELPWPLRFDFVQVEEDDGSRRLMLVGFEVGAPIPRDAEGSDADEYELSAPRIALLWENFNRYKRMAERLLIPAPWNVAEAARTRTAMGRRKRGSLSDSDDYLAVLLAEWRERAGEYARSEKMAAERGIHRSTLTRHIELAQRRAAERAASRQDP